MQAHFQAILPQAEVQAVQAMYSSESEDELLAGGPDFVIDAIDNIGTKVRLPLLGYTNSADDMSSRLPALAPEC